MKCKKILTFWRVAVIVICVSMLCPMLRSRECTYTETSLDCGFTNVSFHKEKNNNITFLSIVECDMRSLRAKDFSTFRNLTGMYISNSLFPYSNLEGFFALLSHVETLVIVSSNISDDFGIMFIDNSKTTELRMPKNNIRFIPKNFPQRFPFLQKIDLSDNKISKIDFLASSNDTKSKPTSVLSNLQYLSSINLLNNSISCLKNFTFTNLCKIKDINLSFNQIENIERIAFNLSDGRHNAGLNLSHNALREVEDGTFSLCSRVTVLDLSSNSILRMHTHAFQGLSSLEELLLGNNKIERVFQGLFEPLGSLRRLDLSGNAIFEIQDGAFARNNSLVDLRLQSNRLRQLTCDSFLNLTSLRTLDLSGNPMGTFRLADFSHLVNLETLSLDLHNDSECDCRLFKQMKEREVKLNISFTSLSDSCSIYWDHYLSANQHWGRECSEPATADECQWGTDKNASLGEEEATVGDEDGDGHSTGGVEWAVQTDTGGGGEEVGTEKEGHDVEGRNGRDARVESRVEEGSREVVVGEGEETEDSEKGPKEGVGRGTGGEEVENAEGEGERRDGTVESRGAEGAGVLVSGVGGREALWMGLGAAGAALCVGVGAVAAWWLRRRRRERENVYARVDYSRVKLNWLPPPPPPPPPPRPGSQHRPPHRRQGALEDPDWEDDAYQKPGLWHGPPHDENNRPSEESPKDESI